MPFDTVIARDPKKREQRFDIRELCLVSRIVWLRDKLRDRHAKAPTG